VAAHIYLLKVTPGNNVNTFTASGKTRVRKFTWTGGDSVRFMAAKKFLIRLEIVKPVRSRKASARRKAAGRGVFRTITDNQSPLNEAVIADSGIRHVKQARHKAEYLCRCTLIDKRTHLVHGWEKTRQDGRSGDPVVHN
jgi:hypothetical protein